MSMVNVNDGWNSAIGEREFTWFLNATVDLSEDIASRSFIRFLSYGNYDGDYHPGRDTLHVPPTAGYPGGWDCHSWLHRRIEERIGDWPPLETEWAQAVRFLEALPPHLHSLTWKSLLPIDEKIGQILESLKIEDVFLSALKYPPSEYRLAEDEHWVENLHLFSQCLQFRKI